MELPISVTWSELILGFIGFVVGLSVFMKAVSEIRTLGWQPFKEKWITQRKARRDNDRMQREEDRQQLTTLVGAVKEMQTTMSGIAGELQTNGGYSLKDTVNRIDRKVEYLQARSRYQDESSVYPMFELDVRGHLTKANGVFCDLLKADEKDLMHHDYISKAVEADRVRLIHELTSAIKHRMPLDVAIEFNAGVKLRLMAQPHVRTGGELLGFFGKAEVVE